MTVGIHAIDAPTYHEDPCDRPSLSASIIHLMCSQSPRHAWQAHPKLNPATMYEEAEHFDIGKIAHSILLEGIDVAAVLDYPDWRKKEARDARDAARTSGKVPILKDKWEDVLAMVAHARIQLNNHREAKQAFKNGRPEQTIIWEEQDVLCRGRLDWLMDDHSAIYDYKTTSASANPEIVSRTLFHGGGDIQAGFYVRGLKAVTGREAIFRFVYQETYPPYALSVVALGPDSMMLAEKKIIWAIDQWRYCLASNSWPGYSDRTCFAGLPVWEENRWLAKETEE